MKSDALLPCTRAAGTEQFGDALTHLRRLQVEFFLLYFGGQCGDDAITGYEKGFKAGGNALSKVGRQLARAYALASCVVPHRIVEDGRATAEDGDS